MIKVKLGLARLIARKVLLSSIYSSTEGKRVWRKKWWHSSIKGMYPLVLCSVLEPTLLLAHLYMSCKQASPSVSRSTHNILHKVNF